MNIYDIATQIYAKLLYQPTNNQKKIVEAFAEYLAEGDSSSIFVLNGYAGTGKTTLLNILCANLPFDDGNLNFSRKTSIGYLRQNSGLESDSTIYEEMRKIFSELIEMNE